MTDHPNVVCHADYCYVAEGQTGCRDGHIPISACPNVDLDVKTPDTPIPGEAMPWYGVSFGEADAETVTATGRPRVVALVGLPNAGKTTALAAYWILLRRGQELAGMRFAGSYTLLGWHAVARCLGWPPEGSRSFPPHTTATGNREPALLHVAMKQGDTVTDILFTDVPGEWFRDWAFDRDAVPGANWIAHHADVFVLLSDSDALRGPERGSARMQYLTLAGRVEQAAAGRPVLPVRAKADLEVPETILETLSEKEASWFGRGAVPMSVHSHEDSLPALLEPLDTVTRMATEPIVMPPGPRAPVTGDPFLDFVAQHFERTE